MTDGVLVIGLGAIGMGYDLQHEDVKWVRTHARAFTVAGSFGPLFAVDPDPAKRRTFAARYGEFTYSSLEEALARHDPGVIVIACPTSTHAQTLTRVLELRAPRAILCEKPLAYDWQEAHAMVQSCEERGVALYVNYMRRADPAVTAVKRMLEQEEILGPLKGVVWYSKGLIHNGSHFIDLVRHWLGAPQRARLISVGRRWQERDLEPDFLLEFGESAISFLAAREECFSHYTLELVARNGRLRYERGGDRVEWQGSVDDPDFTGYRVLEQRPLLLPADMRRSQLNVTLQLASALRGCDTPLCTGKQGVETLRDISRVADLVQDFAHREPTALQD